MEQLKHMKEMLTSCVQGQLSHLDTVDTKELGEAIDMIKDLSEAIYYCTVTKAMDEQGEKKHETMYYPVMYYNEKPGPDGRRYYEDYNMRYHHPYPYWTEEEYYRDMDKMKGRMYYNGGSSNGGGSNGGTSSSTSSSSNGSGARGYSEHPVYLTEMMRDSREGRSPQSRKMYMESKEMHKDKASQLQELEKYTQELTSDLVEMIEGASPEEKQYLSNRIAALASKIK